MENPAAAECGRQNHRFLEEPQDLIGEIIERRRIGPEPGVTVDQIVRFLKKSNSKDAKDALRAQLLATVLN